MKPKTSTHNWIARLQRRGVFRVAASYAVIAWLLLQIADVVLDPMGAPAWTMRALIVLVAIGFPVAVVLAWFFELTDEGIQRDRGDTRMPGRTVHGLRRYTDVAVIAVLLGVIAILLAREPPPARSPETDEPVIAVLPFTELGAAANSHFGFGLADTLIHKLGQLDGLVVLTSHSTFQFGGTTLDLASIGEKLGANIILEGTVQNANALLRVNARLVDQRSGRQLWSDTYDRPSDDLFRVQDEIARSVSDALSLVLTPAQEERLARPVASSITAYDAYTLGRIHLARRGGDVGDAIRLFRQSVELDPEFALGYAALTEALYMAPFYLRREISWPEVSAEAWAAAKTAQRLDPGLADAHLAEFYAAEADNRFGGATRWSDSQLKAMLERALSRNPNSAEAARYLARYATDDSEQLRLLQRAAVLDPRSGIIAYDVSNLLAQMGRIGEAVDWSLRSGTTSEPYFAIGYNNVPIIHAFYAGRLDEATRWTRLLSASLGGQFLYQHYSALWDLGAMEEAETVFGLIEDLEDPSPGARAWLVTNRYINAWRADDRETADALWNDLENQFMAPYPTYPVLARYPGVDWIMALRAISLVRAGEPERALASYRRALPDPESFPTVLESGVFLDPALMTGALLKAAGQDEQGREQIRSFLRAQQDAAIAGRNGVGLGRLLAHGFLGDVAGVRKEFRAVLDAPFTAMNWQLEVARFDPDFEAVVTDPQIAPLYDELIDRIGHMREAYRSDPALPAERVPEPLRLLDGS